MSLYSGRESWNIEIGNEDFDNVAGEGSSRIPDTLVEEHLRQSDEAVKGIEHYVDRRIAHYDLRGLVHPTPTFADLSSALSTLESLVILYWRLLKGSSWTTLLPTIQFEWKDIFRFAWEEQCESAPDMVAMKTK